MSETDFDYGTDEEVTGGSINFVNPEVGQHPAILRSLIHVGQFRENFNNDLKAPAPQVVAIFELKGREDFEEDGETPLEISKSFPLKKGDKAFTTKFRLALDPKGKAKGFDDMIGNLCMVEVKPGKEKNEDGTPKYVNCGALTEMSGEMAEMLEAKGRDTLKVKGSGHVSFADLTKEAILELNPIIDVANTLMKGEKYKGSKAEKIIAEIRKDNPEYATPKAKDGEAKEAPAKEHKEADMDEEEVF